MDQNVFDDEVYHDDDKGDDDEVDSDCLEFVDSTHNEYESSSSDFVDDIGKVDEDDDILSSSIDESEDEDEVGSDDSDVDNDNDREYYSEIEGEESDDGSCSDSGSFGIIPIQGDRALGNAADDHEVILMERVSPEPGM